ncbi:MAG: AraC family transcriptional regulator [Ahrensia sp.]|nr:AraC family transcriptional regulator [Ahrensia sp.]
MMDDLGCPLIDIALTCGFADQPHLTRVFKQLQGQISGQWRFTQEG